MTRRSSIFPSIVHAVRNGLALVVVLAAAIPAGLRAQVASQGVNMVSGVQWPGGDPFLQRQNEPSIAMSSRNQRHLLAGANDYRAVDLPFSTPNAPETGDAWLGVFKSFDGGLTWRSTLLPGYPQQVPRTGPLSSFTTAADPVVRAGTNGLFYYAGIAFNRDTKDGVFFVSRFMDLNNKENGDPAFDQDPIRYIDTRVVDSAAPNAPFIDKPWIAVDKPRLLDGVCNLTVPQPGNPNATVKQTVPAGSVYAAWTEATGTGTALTTNIFFSSSRDCGGSWSQPVRINGTNKVNQGASIAIDPATGVINVVWRRFASGSQTDAIMISRSGRGLLFSTPTVVASLPPYSAANPTAPSFFDQGTSTDSIRTNAYPTIAIDRRPNAGSEDDDEPDNATYRGRIFVAWSQRGVGPGGDARVVLSVSTDGASTWSAPAPIDNASLTDDSGTSFSRGHQFMPQMTVTADRITVIYYDARLDHTFGFFSPATTPLRPDPVTGKLYLETRALKGELLDAGGAARVFTPFFVETGMTKWRHTLDLRVAQADSAASPVFSSARLSQYIFGTRGDETGSVTTLQQLQINPPNLKLFQQGTVPFLGDYIDVAGPTFLPPSAPGRRWRFNSLPGTNPVFLASWTSNQDVRPPANGDWTNYTPPTNAGTSSVFNPSIPRPPCQPGQEGMRNQNIYAARISQGLAVTSVQNAKPLSSTLQRDLTVNVENLTPLSRTFRLTIAGQPVGGRASFVPAPNPVPSPFPAATTTLDVVIPANSSVARSAYALSTDPNALVEIDVAEVSGLPGSPLKANGLTGFVIFNADPSAPTLVNPDNSTAPSVTTVEVYNPNVTNPNVTNPNVTNPNVTNPNVTNPNVTNPNVTNPNVTNPNVTNADLANPNVTNPNVTNPNVTNPNVTNPNVTNPNVTNAPVSDATYTVTNTGNTAATYRVQLAGSAPATPLQLIISKPYANPASLNCVLFEQQRNIPVASVVNPTFVDPNLPPNPAITDPSDGNATFVLAPGESILVTIRGPVDIPTLTNIIQNVAPVVVAHASNTNDPTNKPATSPPSITTSSLPDGVATQPYSATLTALGGTRPYVGWAATGLPAGLSIGGTTTGLISGTPSAAGSYTVGVSATDSAPKTGNRTYTLRIANPLVVTTTALPSVVSGASYSQALLSTGGTPAVTWAISTGSLPPGLTLSGATISGTPITGGTYAFTAQATDSASPPQVKTQSLSIVVAPLLVISTTSLPSIVAGSSYSQTLASTGGTAPLTWAITPSPASLPPGLTLSGATISGTPITAGTYSFTAQATDSTSPPQVKTRSLAIVVAPLLVISTTTLPSVVAGSPYSQTLASTGGTGAVSWTVTSGSLPPGLSLTAATGTIGGTPTTAGSYPFTAQATDSTSPSQVKTRSLTIVVLPVLTVTTASLPNGSVGASYSQSLVATGGSGTLTWSLATGSLPPGIGLSAAGVLSGTPSATGTSSFTVQVVDSGSPQQTATASLSITVGPAPCDSIALAASISAANLAGGAQTINLAAGCIYTFATGSANDPLTALPHITTNITINGNGASLQRSTASGTPAFRLLAVDSVGALTLNNLTVSNGGCTLPCETNLEGGGVYSVGTLNVVLSSFTSNNAGGELTNSRGGAIESFGTLSVDRSTFTSNQAQNNGGAIFNFGGTLTVTNSTFASNQARNVGGAIVAFSPNASTITNSTFVGNTASRLFWGGTETGSAIYNQNGLNWNYPASGPLTVTSSTFAGNGANGTIATETGVATILRNTILAGSAGTNCGGSGAATDGGFNISSDASCGFLPTTGSLSSTDPQLDPGGLSSAGGPTQVVVPLPGSPAVDAIPVNGCGPTTDQRGAPRPTGAGCDIGAVEFPPVLYGWATLQNVKLNGGTNVLTVPAGGGFTLSYDYTIANPPDYCPGCFDQIEIGFAVGVPVCTYDGQPYPPQSGTTSTSFTAPSTPGVYYLAMDWSLDWGCFQPVTPGVTVPPYWHSPPTPNRYIGKVIVP